MLDTVKQRLDELYKEYGSLEPGYDGREHLQDLRKRATQVFYDLKDYVRELKFDRVSQEHLRHYHLSRITLEIKSEQKCAMNKAEALARSSDEYEEYIEQMGQSFSEWEYFNHIKQSCLQLIYTLASDIDSIKAPTS